MFSKVYFYKLVSPSIYYQAWSYNMSLTVHTGDIAGKSLICQHTLYAICSDTLKFQIKWCNQFKKNNSDQTASFFIAVSNSVLVCMYVWTNLNSAQEFQNKYYFFMSQRFPINFSIKVGYFSIIKLQKLAPQRLTP